MIKNKKLLAFIHIEKAAGQTFTRILENNFIYKHGRVAPLKKEHNGIFTADAMRMIFRINPFLEAISGHSIKPFSDLQSIVPNVRYIVLMRDPVERYLSHYQYWVQMMKKDIRFEEFIELKTISNFQTKKIAGTPDLDKAKKILNEKVFLAGTVEKFDDFLMVLKAKLVPQKLDIAYIRKNVARGNIIKTYIHKNFEKYQEQILEKNLLDIELYNYAKNDLFRREQKELLISSKRSELDKISRAGFKIKRDLIGRLYRNLYFSQIIRIIRQRNGLEPGGSY